MKCTDHGVLFVLENSLISDYNSWYEIVTKEMERCSYIRKQKFRNLTGYTRNRMTSIMISHCMRDCQTAHVLSCTQSVYWATDVSREISAGKRLPSKQTINSSVRNLEKKGILYLEKGTGRDKKIFLTEKGRQLVKEKIRPS